jgi:hypothetical protein
MLIRVAVYTMRLDEMNDICKDSELEDKMVADNNTY